MPSSRECTAFQSTGRAQRGIQRSSASMKQAIKSVNCLRQTPSLLASSIPNTGRGGLASTSESTQHQMFSSQMDTLKHFLRRALRTSASVKELQLLHSQPEIGPGLLVEFKKDQKAGLALLQRPDGSKNWKAVDIRGHVHSLRPSQIGYVLPGKDFTASDMESILNQSIQHFADKNELMLAAWEIVSEDKDQLYNVVEMADLLFNKTDSASCYTAHRLLNEDRRYFKQASRFPPTFTPRPPSEVQRITDKEKAEQEAAEESATMQKAFWAAHRKSFAKKPSKQEWLAGPWRDTILAIEDHALKGDTAQADASKIVVNAMSPITRGNVTPEAAGDLLIKLGFWPPHTHLAPLRAGFTDDFSEAVQVAAQELASNQLSSDLDLDKRMDMTHLQAWAIDNEHTTEVDDAISIETLPNGKKRVWVHVADPTCVLKPDSVLSKEALRRASTLYLPTGSTPMFPKEIAEGLFSLSPDQTSRAFSIHIELDEEGAISTCEPVNTLVQIQRVTYINLDKQLQGLSENPNAELQDLLKIANLRQKWRLARGASLYSIPECDLFVKIEPGKDPEISMEACDTERSASRRLVAELMILANEAFALIGEREGIPLPYRGQAAVVIPEPEEIENIPEGYFREFFMRGRMTRGVLTTSKPLSHGGLGLDRYVQSTSPIRRYSDLLTHWQIKAHLRGEKLPFDVDSLSEIADELQIRTREIKIITREVSKYWLAIFFQQQKEAFPNKIYRAVLLGWIRQDTGFATALILEYSQEVTLRIPRPARVGEELILECVSSDPIQGEIVFQESKEHVSVTQNDMEPYSSFVDISEESTIASEDMRLQENLENVAEQPI